MKIKISFLFQLLLMFSACIAQDYNILDFGAISSRTTSSTAAIQKAIDKANANGGGRVLIPNGEFVTGSIVMKSGVNLHLANKAKLIGSTNPDDYIKIKRWKALIIADGSNKISISGKGVIDGRGTQLALNIDSLFYAGKIDSSDYNFVERRPKYYLRPQLIEFVRCHNVSITDVTLKNAACWVQTYELCKRVVIDGITVDSDAYWNNDGLDIVDCHNVQVINCKINAADDGICLKSSVPNNRNGKTDYHGSNPCDSIYIANCSVRSSASAVKLGSRGVGGFKNVIIRNIKVYDTYRSAIALESVDGGFLEDVLIENIKAYNTGNAIFIRLGQRIRSRNPGTLKNVVIRDICVQIPFERPDYAYHLRGPALPFFHNTFPASITGLPGYNVENLTLENIKITFPGRGNKAYAYSPLSRLNDVPEKPHDYPEFSMFGELPAWGFYIRHVNGLNLKKVQIKIKKSDYRPALIFDDVSNLKINGLKISGDEKENTVIFHRSKAVPIKD